MKDPLHQEKTPYEILGVSTDTPSVEINKALPKYIKKNGTKNISEAQTAMKELKDVNKRTKVDFFHYVLSGNENEGSPVLDIDINNYLEIPVLKIEDIFTDLDKEDFSDEFMEIQFKQFEISSCKYDDLEHSKPDVIFDK